MSVNIVTGMTGRAHITSDDDRMRNAACVGDGKFVMPFGSEFEAEVVNNNLVRIKDGMLMNQGTQMGIELTDYEDVVIENGLSGTNRNDLIVMRYEKQDDTGLESASLVVIKGTSGDTAVDPEYTTGNILDGGDLIDDMPLYRVKIESLSIVAVEKLFEVKNDIGTQLEKALEKVSDIANGKMDKTNPTGTGSFSMNRKAETNIGLCSHAEGHNATASGPYSHAEGDDSTASGNASHAEGGLTEAKSGYSHAEGYNTKATKNYSHAEGGDTIASGLASHAEGSDTEASGNYCHAEGGATKASGDYSHAEGSDTIANGLASHAGGIGTIAGYENQTAIGKFNDNKEGNLFEIGNGRTEANRSNAFEVTNGGSVHISGDYYDKDGNVISSSGNASKSDVAILQQTVGFFVDNQLKDGIKFFNGAAQTIGGATWQIDEDNVEMTVNVTSQNPSGYAKRLVALNTLYGGTNFKFVFWASGVGTIAVGLDSDSELKSYALSANVPKKIEVPFVSTNIPYISQLLIIEKIGTSTGNFKIHYPMVVLADVEVNDDFPDSYSEYSENVYEKLKTLITGIDNKVDKIDGKSLSTNDYSNKDKQIVGGITAALSNKVDKNGTDSLMTADEHNKLSGIAPGAEVNVQPDWSQSDDTKDDFIKNKPSIPSKTSDLTNDSNFVSDEDYTHTDNNYTNDEKEDVAKIDGIESDVSNLSSDTELLKSTIGYTTKNQLPMTVEGIKAANTSGTWSGNTYSLNGVSFTIQTDNNGLVTGILVNGTATKQTIFNYVDVMNNTFGGYLFNGYSGNTNSGSYVQLITYLNGSSWSNEAYQSSGVDVAVNSDYPMISFGFLIRNNFTVNNILIQPMLRKSTIADPTFEPYQENVDDRLNELVSKNEVVKDTVGYEKKNLMNPNYRTDVGNNILHYTENGITLEAGVYTISYSVKPDVQYVQTMDENIILQSGASSATFTLSSDTTVKFNGSYGSQSIDLSTVNVQLERGTTATDYTPYKDDVDTRLIANETALLTTKSATGNPISVSDSAHVNAEELTVELKPKQDLNGYDYPWVGGTGKNKLNYDIWKTVDIVRGTAVFENNGVTLTATNNDCYTGMDKYYPTNARISVSEGDIVRLTWEENENKDGIVYIFGNGDANNSVSMNNVSSKSVVYNVPSGIEYINFRFGVTNSGDTISYKNIMIQINTNSTEYEPYSNICPITGYDSMSLVRSGKNYIPSADEKTIVNNGMTFHSNGKGKYNINGIATSPASATFDLDEFVIPASDTHTFYLNNNNSGEVTIYFRNNGQIIDSWKLDSVNKSSYSYQQMGGKTCTEMVIVVESGESVNITLIPQILQKSDDRDTYTLQFGETVYGAEVDFVRGKALVKYGFADLGDLDNWGYSGGDTYPVFTNYGLTSMHDIADNDIIPNFKCTNYESISANAQYQNGADSTITANTGKELRIRDTRYTDVGDFKTAMSGVQLAYELATPYEIQLTPQQIKMLKGNNVLMADGEMELEYQVDNTVGEIKESIEKEIENLPKELPPVDSSDDGKVLGVVNGEWGKISVESDGPLVVEIIQDANSPDDWTTNNYNLNNIKSALDEEREIFMIVTLNSNFYTEYQGEKKDMMIRAHVSHYSTDNSDTFVTFSTIFRTYEPNGNDWRSVFHLLYAQIGLKYRTINVEIKDL